MRPCLMLLHVLKLASEALSNDCGVRTTRCDCALNATDSCRRSMTSVTAVCTTKNVRQVATDFRSCISCCRRFSQAHNDIATDFPNCCQCILHTLKIMYWDTLFFQTARIDDFGGGLPVTCDHRPGLPIPNQSLSKNARKLGMGRGSEEGGASLP